MKTSSLFLAVAAFLIAAPSLHAQQTGPTPFPDQKDEAAWPGKGPIRTFPYMTDNRKSFWLKRDQSQNAVVFVGDSFFGNWYSATPKIEASFPQVKHVVNRCIGGEVSRGTLFRLQEDILDLHPTAVVLLVGNNDLTATGPVSGIIENITTILDEIQKAYPTIPIILCNLPPRNSTKAPVDPALILKVNGLLADLAKSRQHVTLFDTFSVFADADGKAIPELFKADGVHPDNAGYVKVSVALGKVFEQEKIQ